MPPRPRSYDETAHRREFGARVRVLRLEREWSQEQLAEQAGLDRTYIVGIEGGHRNPSLDSIWALAAGLGISLAELFET